MKVRSIATGAVVTLLVLSMIGAVAVGPAASQVDATSTETDTDDVSQSNTVSQSDETSITSTNSEIDESSSVTIDDTVDVSVDTDTGTSDDVGAGGILESLFETVGGTDGDTGSVLESLLDGLGISDGIGDDIDGDESDDSDAGSENGTDDGDASDEDGTDDSDAENGTDDGSSDALDRAAVERYVHEAVNEERTERGLEALAFDTDLRDIARAHSEDMAERGYFAHVDPEGNDVTDRYEAADYECSVNGYTGGENIAQTWYDVPVRTDDGTVTYETEQELADGIVTQWMNSPGHRENLLAPYWENEGIGVYVTDDNRVFATQNFC